MTGRAPDDGAGPPREPAIDQAAGQGREQFELGLAQVGEHERHRRDQDAERADRPDQREHQEAAEEELRGDQIQGVRDEQLSDGGGAWRIERPDIGEPRVPHDDRGHDRAPDEHEGHARPPVAEAEAVARRVVAEPEHHDGQGDQAEQDGALQGDRAHRLGRAARLGHAGRHERPGVVEEQGEGRDGHGHRRPDRQPQAEEIHRAPIRSGRRVRRRAKERGPDPREHRGPGRSVSRGRRDRASATRSACGTAAR